MTGFITALTLILGPQQVVPEVVIQTPSIPPNVEMVVIEYFKDQPIMIDIAWCESNFTHWEEDWTVLRGNVTPKDVGVMQINEGYHLERSQKLGFNLHTLEGNLGYAQWLYKKEGVKPWNASSKCWKKNPIATKTTSTNSL